MSGSCAVCVDRVLYLFGGHHARGNTNKVSRVTLLIRPWGGGGLIEALVTIHTGSLAQPSCCCWERLAEKAAVVVFQFLVAGKGLQLGSGVYKTCQVTVKEDHQSRKSEQFFQRCARKTTVNRNVMKSMRSCRTLNQTIAPSRWVGWYSGTF